MASDALRRKVSQHLLEAEALHHELRQAMPILVELCQDDKIVRKVVDRLDDLLKRVEKSAEG